MLQIFWFLPFLAAITSATLLGAMWRAGDLWGRGLALSLAALVMAGYCQFFAASPMVAAGGLLAQTMLAVVLIVRWRMSQ